MRLRGYLLLFALILTFSENVLAEIRILNPLTETEVTVKHNEKKSLGRVFSEPRLHSYSLNVASMNAMKVGDVAYISTPKGANYQVIYDRTDKRGGGEVWVGHINGEGGIRHPVHISIFQNKIVGTISSPEEKFNVAGSLDIVSLVEAANLDENLSQDLGSDALFRVGSHGVIDQSLIRKRSAPATDTFAPASTNTPTQLDVMVLYTVGYASSVGGDDVAKARINQLISMANTAYANSGIFVVLRLVYANSLIYPDSDGIPVSQALSDLSTGTISSQCNQVGTGGILSVPSLRNQYGADLVVLLRADKYPKVHCNGSTIIAPGLAWMGNPPGNNSDTTGFSIVQDFYAPNSIFDSGNIFIHEIGHNMGSQHDPITQLIPFSGGVPQGSDTGGYPVYNRGYCNGKAGTIMAYPNSYSGCPEIVQLFSNPSISTCNGLVCGVPAGQNFSIYVTGVYAGTSVGADNAAAINANAPYMAAYRSSAPVVISSGGPNGSISPLGEVIIPKNGVASFTITPNRGYIGKVKSTCGGSLSNGIYTTSSVTSDCVVSASFINSSVIATILSDECDSTLSLACSD